jgi:hypothetical protein
MRLSLAAAALGDPDRADLFSMRAFAASAHAPSSHSLRTGRVYKTEAVALDDILPPGLLSYTTASVSDISLEPDSRARWHMTP